MKILSEPRWAPPEASLLAVRDQINRAFGLRVDLNAIRGLGKAEQAELVELANKISDGTEWRDDSRRLPLAQLPKAERRRFERLVGKAAGIPKFFDDQREQVRLKEEVEKLAVRARRPDRRTRLEEA